MNKAQIGVYGLGTMGSALALNLAEKGFRVAVTNREVDWIAPFVAEARAEAGALADHLIPAQDLGEFVAAIARPRAILFMIPAGAPMDAMIAAVRPLLAPGDMIIDGGNANFRDTIRRSADLEAAGFEFIGMGVSGGEEGARNGPSMMVGGSAAGWAHLKPMAEAIAARFEGDPCVAHLGTDGAGHFVKTVHNGIEYADMQMIAEVYGLLRDGAGWDAGRIGALFADWNDGPLASFLIEASAAVLGAVDADSGAALVDLIVDAAGQKGTGRWTVIEALRLGVSASAIEAAVGARAWSAGRDVRRAAAQVLDGPDAGFAGVAPDVMARALLAGRILAHAQGFAILAAASDEFDWSLDLARIAEIWRAGCIIRSGLLDDLARALRVGPPLGEVILSPEMVTLLNGSIADLRQAVGASVQAGLPVPSLAAALAWYDSIRQARGTANLIQGQRDFFGAHGFARIDTPGRFHGEWT
jgi:6-phosphogluconate dehydrogenase